MTAYNEPLRDSLYSVGAASLLTVTHDLLLRAIEIYYRLKAISNMQTLVRESETRRCSAQKVSIVRKSLPGCARLLSWFALDKYACHTYYMLLAFSVH